MWTRVMSSKFKSDEGGALLVFFAMCCAAIFLIAALSFDLGRRASTQTELQSFADNVALAAAGELNGLPGAIPRAKTAAANLISDSFVFGNGDRTLAGAGDYAIFFYETLPPDDKTALTTAGLDQSDPDNDFIARFVRVEVNDVEVDWAFAKLLSIFSTDPLPPEEVDAEAVAGYTSLACDIAPVFFCMPNESGAQNALDLSDADGDGSTRWNPENHIGEQILLRTGQGGNSFWDSGNFGWLDPRELDPYASLVDAGGDCAGLNGAPLLVCLIAAENGVVNCYENGLLTTLPGQKQGIESAVFNTRFDMFNATVSQYEGNTNFQPAPIITRGFVDSGGDVCLKNSVQEEATMAFPNDDCFGLVDGGPNCFAWDGVVRFGDGDWTEGRLAYVEQNYSIDGDTYQTDPLLPPNMYHADDNDSDPFDETIDAADGTPLYHKDDMFAPGYNAANGTNYPVLPAGASRWQYYVAEVMTTLYANPAQAYTNYINNPSASPGALKAGVDPTDVSTLTSIMPQTMPQDMNDADDTTNGPGLTRAEDGLPACAPNGGGGFSIDPRRRVVTAAIVDCDAQEVKGKTSEVQATYFVETFITQPVKGDPTDKKKFDMWIEIIGPPLNTGSAVVEKGVFQNLVQLYR